MTVESATYIDSLDPTLPLSGDPKSEGDNHLRLIKQVLKNTFPNINAAVNATDEQLNAAQSLSGRTNILLNPHGSIRQETSSPITLSGTYVADQWRVDVAAAGAAFESNVVSGGISDYDLQNIYVKTTTAKASLAAGDFSFLLQLIEGYAIRKLFYGQAGAKTSWLRFRASASQNGIASVAIRNGLSNRSFVQTFAVTTTPTDYAIQVPGDTTGTWASDHTVGANVSFCHAAGTTYQTSTLGAWQAGNFIAGNTQSNMLDTVNRQLNVTDVMWHRGNVLLPFEPIDYILEQTKCERYFQTYSTNGLNTYNQNPNLSLVTLPLRTYMRVAPALVNASVSGFAVENATTNLISMFLDRTDNSLVQVGFNGSGGPAQGTSGRYLVGSGIRLQARL